MPSTYYDISSLVACCCVVKVLFGAAEDTAAAWHQSQAATVNSLEREVKQMAMETWLREVGLAHHTKLLLALGLCSVEDISDPVQAPDAVLLGAGFSQTEVIAAGFRCQPCEVSLLYLPPVFSRRFLLCSVVARTETVGCGCGKGIVSSASFHR